MNGFEEGRQKGYEEGLIRAEEENEAKHHENQRFFKESLEKALTEISKEEEKMPQGISGRIKRYCCGSG